MLKFQIIKWIVKKLVSARRSATIGVATGLLAGAVWIQNNPDIVIQVVGAGWGGVVVGLAALAVAVARLRTLGRDKPESTEGS